MITMVSNDNKKNKVWFWLIMSNILRPFWLLATTIVDLLAQQPLLYHPHNIKTNKANKTILFGLWFMLGYHALLDNLQRFLVTFLGMSMCLIMKINAHNKER